MQSGTNGPIYTGMRKEYNSIKENHDARICGKDLADGLSYMQTWEDGPYLAWREAAKFVTFYWICHRNLSKQDAYQDAVIKLKKELKEPGDGEKMIDKEIAKHKAAYTKKQEKEQLEALCLAVQDQMKKSKKSPAP